MLNVGVCLRRAGEYDNKSRTNTFSYKNIQTYTEYLFEMDLCLRPNHICGGNYMPLEFQIILWRI